MNKQRSVLKKPKNQGMGNNSSWRKNWRRGVEERRFAAPSGEGGDEVLNSQAYYGSQVDYLASVLRTSGPYIDSR